MLHNSPAKPCPVEPTLTAAVKKIDKKLAEFTFTNNTTSSQLLTNLSLAWPQATNGNLLSVKMDGTLIYSTSTASPLNTSTFLANTTAKRTIAAGDSVVLQFNFTNNVDKTASNYTGSATFDPFGAVSFP